MSQKRQILTLRVGAIDCRHHGSRRIDSGLLAEQLVANLLVTDPYMHLATDRVAEKPIVLVAELPHRKPWAVWVNIVNTSNVGNRRCRSRNELQAGASRWLIMDEEVMDQTNGGHQREDSSTDHPLVGEQYGANGGGGFGLE